MHINVGNVLQFLRNADYIFGTKNGILMSEDNTDLLMFISSSNEKAKETFLKTILSSTDNDFRFEGNDLREIRDKELVVDVNKIHLVP